MTDIESFFAGGFGFLALAVILGYAALRAGMVEGSLTVRIVPLRKRKPEAAIEPSQEATG